MDITLNSHISLVSTEIRKDKKNYIVENITLEEFYEMPKVCIDAIKLIQQDLPLYDVEKRIKDKYPEEDVNILDFAEQLLEFQLIASVDGIQIENRSLSKESAGLLWISPKIGNVFFNKFSLLLYLSLFLINIALFFIDPGLFPRYKDIFIFKSMFLNIPVWIVLTSLVVLIHELGHIFAIRANNLPTRLGIGHRLFIVVLETEMSSAWKLPSLKRNVLYIAGLCFDIVIIFVSFAGQLMLSDHSPLLIHILRFIVLNTFTRMIYQCCIYMKTDLYYLFENISGCYNLMENAQHAIKRYLHFGRSGKSEEVVFSEERNTVFLYSIFYFIGVFLTIFIYIVFYIPQLVFSVKKVIPGLETSPGGFTFWDSALFILQLLLGLLLLLSSWKKKYLNSREA